MGRLPTAPWYPNLLKEAPPVFTHVDASACSFLPLCECGWRGSPASSHERALGEIADHERRCHPGHNHARKALRSYQWRHSQP